MAGHELNQIKQWADVLADKNVEMFVLWKYGCDEVFCAIGSPKGGEAFQINDPMRPIDNLAPQDPS